MTCKRILFVDDEQSLLDGLQDILRKHRREWKMVFALGAEAALAELAAAPCDVIVSDMRMPGLDGAALLERVRDDYPQVARIVLSGHAEREAVVRALPVAHQYLSKPCDVAVLQAVIERMCHLQALVEDDVVRTTAGRLDRLPSVPSRHRELVTVSGSAACGLADVTAVVETDPAMAAKVLQLANSAYFGSGQRTTSVRRAAAYLGVDLIQDMVATTQVFDPVAMPMRGGLSLERLQQHSLRTARLAGRLMPDQSRAEEAFTAALLHDVGKIVLALGFPDRYADVLALAQETGRPLYEVEKGALGVTHAEAGAYLLGVWGLPCSIVEAIAYHHTPRLASPGTRDVIAAIHVADALANGAAPPHRRHLIDLEFLDEVGLASSLPAWERIATDELDALVEVRQP